MDRDPFITPSRLILLVAGILLVGAVLWIGLRPGRQARRRLEPVARTERAMPSLPPAGSSPMADLKKANAALKKLLMYPSPSSSPEYDAERAEMRRIVRGLLLLSLPIDFEELLGRALAGRWDDIHADQRTELVGVVRALVARHLARQLYDVPDYELRFLKETIAGSEATVDATLEFPYKRKRASVAMEWRLLYKQGSWLAYDIITDQQSMLETYRAELDKIITNRSFDDLLGRMKRRLAQTE